jgi:hypothetical protein
MQESGYWNRLWSQDGWKLFSSARETANLEQLEIILGAKKSDNHVTRPSVDEICRVIVRVCHLGHNEVIERLL